MQRTGYGTAMELTIFHYHLLPGGVSSVIRHAVEALSASPGRISKIRIVTGGSGGTFHIKEGLSVEVQVVPEIGYGVHGDHASLLLERFGSHDAVWWIHNYHVGKNPAFTRALLEIAQSRNPPGMILQPHDFPEAGRFHNLADLDRNCTLPLYPVGPRVRYAVINRRDRGVLISAGIPESRLFLLENPVPPYAGPRRDSDGRRHARKSLFPGLGPEDRVFLYPVRAIRRKNVLEAGLITLLAGSTAKLVVTLPGVSEQERAYSLLVQDAFNAGIIPGRFGIGAAPSNVPLDEAAAASDMVVSSSVQEGFGYFFIQALQWGLPLLARGMDSLEGMSGLFSGYPAVFYSGVLCQPDRREKSRLKSLYNDKLRRLSSVFPDLAVEKLEGELAGILGGESVDFSYLDPLMQMGVIKAASGSADVRAGLRDINNELARSAESLRFSDPCPGRPRLEERFGPAVFAAGLERIIESFDTDDGHPCEVDPWEIQRNVRKAFSKSEYIRLLYD